KAQFALVSLAIAELNSAGLNSLHKRAKTRVHKLPIDASPACVAQFIPYRSREKSRLTGKSRIGS
ncbi:MAG TPA: hypothetical protein VGG82_01670, partial [Casimicrobiaceae bacterium]